MKLWSLIPVLLLASQPLLPARIDPAMEMKGRDALANGLFEIAERRFRSCFEDPAITAEEKPRIALQLAEAMIRSGKSSEALDLLSLSLLQGIPETTFWKAQALASAGRFIEAATHFAEYLESSPPPLHREEAGFSLASIHLALRQPDAALETLGALAKNAPTTTLTRVNLMRLGVMLDQNRPADARKLLPPDDLLTSSELRTHADFLEAHILLAEKRFPEAASAFQALLSQPQGQSVSRYHAAAIGLADALDAKGARPDAVKSLITFLLEHPDSPRIDAMFQRLLQWLPESPSPTDPLMEQLALWITPPEAPVLGAITPTPPDAKSAAASVCWPTEVKTSELLAYSLFTRAVALGNQGAPANRAEARSLLNRLRLDYSLHPLAARAIHTSARWFLDEGRIDQAFAMLDTLRESAGAPAIKGEAAFAEARAAYQQGNPDLAAKLFEEAASILPTPAAEAASLNAGIASLNTNPTSRVVQPTNPALANDLALERALSTSDPVASRSALVAFLNEQPTHPRSPEARLAAAEAALAAPTPDFDFARAQLDELENTSPAGIAPSRIALARLRIADLSHAPSATVALATSFLETWPTDPFAADVSLTLGRNLFESGDYNPSRLVLEKLAAQESRPARAQAAWLLAARAAALVGTLSSKEEALILFDKAISLEGPLRSIARLEKADHLIKNLYRFKDAADFLRSWFSSMPGDDPLRLPAGLQLGQALYAQGGSDVKSMEEALAVYDQLIPHSEKYPALIHRLHYLRGMVLEQLPDPSNPGHKRDAEALDTYYSVLETTNPPAEWEYFENCGFKALSLKEKAADWKAAVAVAEKIASFKGPRAEEAATRAEQLRLKHMIWDNKVAD